MIRINCFSIKHPLLFIYPVDRFDKPEKFVIDLERGDFGKPHGNHDVRIVDLFIRNALLRQFRLQDLTARTPGGIKNDRFLHLRSELINCPNKP